MRTIWGRCWAGEGAPAFWPWVQIFRTCLGDASAEHLDKLIDSEAPQVADLLPEIAPKRGLSSVARLRPVPSNDSGEARFRLFGSAARLLKNVARAAPLVLVLDDLHEADQPSLLLLRFVARELKETPVLILGNFREAEVRASPALSRLIGELAHEGQEIPLCGLNESEVGSFSSSAQERAAMPPL